MGKGLAGLPGPWGWLGADWVLMGLSGARGCSGFDHEELPWCLLCRAVPHLCRRRRAHSTTSQVSVPRQWWQHGWALNGLRAHRMSTWQGSRRPVVLPMRKLLTMGRALIHAVRGSPAGMEPRPVTLGPACCPSKHGSPCCSEGNSPCWELYVGLGSSWALEVLSPTSFPILHSDPGRMGHRLVLLMEPCVLEATWPLGSHIPSASQQVLASHLLSGSPHSPPCHTGRPSCR